MFDFPKSIFVILYMGGNYPHDLMQNRFAQRVYMDSDDKKDQGQIKFFSVLGIGVGLIRGITVKPLV